MNIQEESADKAGMHGLYVRDNINDQTYQQSKVQLKKNSIKRLKFLYLYTTIKVHV